MTGTILVTGGAGFVGSNLVNSLLHDGHDVTIFDALSRPGSERNLAWLLNRYRNGQLRCVQGDVRDFDALCAAAQDVDVIYHLAAQVAVTSSVMDPRADFEINALGTLNLLEAARLNGRTPIIVFTSTNKVYGGMEDVAVVERETRYEYRDFPHGIPESRPLDFHSPYGCSKGAMDQYVRDYARIYDLPTVVFRMSCIYGPRQFGTEDQGWLAHFMISAVTGRPITIYGDGKQVRDILFIDDLVRAFRLAVEKIDTTAGQVYNIGGGPSNKVSVWREFGAFLAELRGAHMPVCFDQWRPGDQLCYVSDIGKANLHMGWQPKIDWKTGIRRLWKWVSTNQRLFQTLAIGNDAPFLGEEKTA
jgi:CDP-paratose 2-epimerase